jgi:hypothetical protein
LRATEHQSSLKSGMKSLPLCECKIPKRMKDLMVVMSKRPPMSEWPITLTSNSLRRPTSGRGRDPGTDDFL